MLTDILPAYPYTNFQDDDNIRAFFDAYNTLAQELYDWLSGSTFPVFIGGTQGGPQLHWLVEGIYGQTPPTMVNSKETTVGPYNTFAFNQLGFNTLHRNSESTQVVTSDDIFRRILTWNFYKADGFTFSVPWLKRRVRRFLEGTNGTDITNDQQWGVSVTFTGDGGITIELDTASQGAGYIDLTFASVFKSAFDNQLLHMPFWASVTVKTS